MPNRIEKLVIFGWQCGNLNLLIDAVGFYGTKVKSDLITAENLTDADESLFWVGIAI